jgi:hypothetical protein
MTTREQTDTFIKSYIEAMLWANVCWETETGDAPAGQEARLTRQQESDLAKDARDFLAKNETDIASLRDFTSDPYGQSGHDFALTRNHHGAGFWDRGYGAVGKRLTRASEAYGEANIFASIDDRSGVIVTLQVTFTL